MIFYPKCCLLIFLVYNFQTDLKKILSFLLLAEIQYFSLKKARLPCTRRARPCTTRTRFYLALKALGSAHVRLAMADNKCSHSVVKFYLTSCVDLF